MCRAGTLPRAAGMELEMKMGSGRASSSDPELLSLDVIKSWKRKELYLSSCSHTCMHTAAETGCWISFHLRPSALRARKSPAQGHRSQLCCLQRLHLSSFSLKQISPQMTPSSSHNFLSRRCKSSTACTGNMTPVTAAAPGKDPALLWRRTAHRRKLYLQHRPRNLQAPGGKPQHLTPSASSTVRQGEPCPSTAKQSL